MRFSPTSKCLRLILKQRTERGVMPFDRMMTAMKIPAAGSRANAFLRNLTAKLILGGGW